MKLAFLWSVRSRLVMLVVLSLLPVLAIMFYHAAEQRKLDAVRAQVDAQRQASLAVAELERTVVATQQVLLLLAQLPELRANPQTCDGFLAKLIASYPMYGNFNVISRDGVARCASLPALQRVYLGDRSYFTRALKTRSFAAGDYTVGRTTGRPSIVFAVPMMEPRGDVESVLSVGIDLMWLNRHLGELKWPEGTALTLIDQSGTIVASHPRAELVGRSLRGKPEIIAMMSQRTGTGRTLADDGSPMLVGFATSAISAESARVHVMLGIPERTAFAAANAQLARGILFVCIAAALGIALAWRLGERVIARPVGKMVSATAQIADGNLTARTGVAHDESELGSLAKTFDVMASDLRAAYVGTVEVLADAIEARDPYTGGHVKRVCDYSLAIGRELGWNERQLLQLQMAAALHDVGKIGVPDAVLRKQGPLDAQELPVMRSHTRIGAELLDDVPFLAPAMQCALGHQEFFDGRGYPQGLSGESIPPEARVVAIADTFDAMTTDRPYRKGMTIEVALAEIQRCAGTQFDPLMVDAFVRVIQRER